MEGSYEACLEAASWLRARLQHDPPRVGLVCGSGLGALGEALEEPQSFSYAEIPNFPRSTVPGHAGRLLIGRLGGATWAVLQGRFHLYEGYSPAQVAMPTRTLALLGVHTLVLTNAAGSLDPALRPGQLLVLGDHIDLPGLAGRSPLVGPNDDRFGPRFPSMLGAYDRRLQRLALALAPPALGARPGVYCGVGGPSYETPAECRLLRALGAQAVGMSTVSEAVAARHCGLRLLGLSLATNMAAGEEPLPLPLPPLPLPLPPQQQPGEGHQGVLQAAQAGARLLRELLQALAPELGRGEGEREEGEREGERGEGGGGGGGGEGEGGGGGGE